MLSPRQFGNLAADVSQPGGGATVDTRTGERKTSGWAVALHGREHTEPAGTFGPESLRRYTQQHSQALSQPGHHLGLWHDKGAVYHDVSVVHPDTYGGGVRSIAEGYHQKQLAVYNMDRDQTISMRPRTGSEQRGTRRAMKSLRSQRPEPEGKISEMPTSQLAAALRNRRPV